MEESVIGIEEDPDIAKLNVGKFFRETLKIESL